MPPVEHNPLHAFVCREIELLDFLGMDQNSIAAAVGISQGFLSMMLNGRRKATLKRVHAITQLASERKDAAIRSSVSHVQETIALPPSAQRDHVLSAQEAVCADQYSRTAKNRQGIGFVM